MGAGSDHVEGTFSASRAAWLAQGNRVRNVVRQELIARQLDRHLPPGPLRVLDIGAGQGLQSIRLGRLGHTVHAVEPDPVMRERFAASLAAEAPAVRDRVTLTAGSIGALGEVVPPDPYDLVLLLGVLMYLPASEPVLAEVVPRVGPGGLLSVAVRSATSALWRPAARQDWPAALAAFEEARSAAAERRDVRYVNEIGAPARADDLDRLVASVAGHGLELREWYGVRTAVDLAEADPVPPGDPAELAALLDVEEQLGSTDPFRQLAQLAHLVFSRPSATTAIRS